MHVSSGFHVGGVSFRWVTACHGIGVVGGIFRTLLVLRWLFHDINNNILVLRWGGHYIDLSVVEKGLWCCSTVVCLDKLSVKRFSSFIDSVTRVIGRKNSTSRFLPSVPYAGVVLTILLGTVLYRKTVGDA